MNERKNIIAQIGEKEAYIILKRLADEDDEIKNRIEKTALDYLSEVDVNEVADRVFFELESIQVEELWDRSGKKRHGYVEPNEEAWEMFEEGLESFIHQMKKYQNLSMHEEAKRFCLGVLKGIYKFGKKEPTQFAEWASDAPCHYFEVVFDEWKGRHEDENDIGEVEDVIEKEMDDW